MNELTYNIKIKFDKEEDKSFWLNLLYDQQKMFNLCSKTIHDNKLSLKLKEINQNCYSLIKKNSEFLNAQCVIKTEQEVLGKYRNIKSNKHKNAKIPEKKSLCLRLDKRLYSSFNKNSIKLTSNESRKRCIANLQLYPKIEEMFNTYTTCDPLIFYRNGEFYLSVTFNVNGKVQQNEDVIGLDLGCRRLVTDSNGNCITSKDFLKQKRKYRYLKRCLQAKKKNSHSARTKLKKLSHKEHNFSKQYIEKSVNTILKNTKEDIIAIEDLTKIKKSTQKKYSSHNNRISQVPFYMFKQILTYKATLNGKVVKTVSPKFTSQIDCTTNKRDGERKGCRYYSKNRTILDADWNAAINIRNRAANIKHLISYNKLPLDGTLNLLNKQVVVNQPIVNKIISNLQGPTL